MTRLVAEALPRPQRLRLLVGLWRRGYTDDQIADALTYSTYTTARIRAGLGLAANPKQERSPCPTSVSPTQHQSTRSSGPPGSRR